MRLSRKSRRELYRESLKRTSGRYRTTHKAIEEALPLNDNGNAIHPGADTVMMSWGPAYSFDAIKNEFDILEFKGSKKVTPSTPNWYRTVRTDTTDRQDTAKSSVDKRNRW